MPDPGPDDCASTPFGAALTELLRTWRAHDDLRRERDVDPAAVDLARTIAVWEDLHRARSWVGSFEGAGRTPGW
jgi:hypothetical protein